MKALLIIGQWIFGHTNKVTEFGRQVMYALILFKIIHWTPEQQIGALAAVSAFFAMFTEGGTVSKVRMDARIGEVESKVEEKAERKADAKIAAMVTDSNSGTFKAPNLS